MYLKDLHNNKYFVIIILLFLGITASKYPFFLKLLVDFLMYSVPVVNGSVCMVAAADAILVTGVTCQVRSTMVCNNCLSA